MYILNVTFLGTVNRTDQELVGIQIAREGFHNFYRNCEHFTTWYIQALWPDISLATRGDQLLGKLVWWFKDRKKTIKLKNIEAVDFSTK